MREAGVRQGEQVANVVCTWCGHVIRHAAEKPARRMCQTCFARMMSEHSRANRLHGNRQDASER